MRAGERKRVGRLAAFALAVLGLTLVSGAERAEAIDWDGRWWVGARASDYLPADEINGGFRVNDEIFGSRTERDVKAKETFYPALTLGYGLKRWDGSSRWRRFQLSIELDVAKIDTTVGDETGFRDLDGSSRLETVYTEVDWPLIDQDQDFISFPLGDLELTPVFANALFHWGNDRADFYAGAGLGLVLADITESQEYRDFTGDFDGVDDVTVDDSLALNLKLGSNIRLTPNGNAFLFFELSYFSTGLFGGNQVQWTGTLRDGENGVFLDTTGYDTNDDGTADLVLGSDLRIVDPGKVRVDGATAGIGIRFRFGGGRSAAADEAAGF